MQAMHAPVVSPSHVQKFSESIDLHEVDVEAAAKCALEKAEFCCGPQGEALTQKNDTFF